MDKGNARVTGAVGQWALALRERRGVFVPLVVWAVLSVVTALAGPFETYETLPPLSRLGYWALVVGVSVLVDAGFRLVMRGQGLLRRLAGRLGFAVVLGLAIHGINLAVFPTWGVWDRVIWLIGVVWAVAMAVEGLVALSRHAHLVPEADEADMSEVPAPDAAFQQRLPYEKRGSLIRLEAQDHYLNAVTEAGAALILMRLSDAEAELAGYDGLRVHRSHWVARAQVRQVLRREGRLFLVMVDGAEVPVSRSYKAAVEAVGLGA